MFDLNTATNWQQIYSNSFTASVVSQSPRFVFVPIPAVNLPITINSSFIGIYSTSTDYLEEVKIAGIIYQLVTLNGGSLPDDHFLGYSRRFYTNKITLIEMPQKDISYSLRLLPRFYVSQLTISIWEFVEPTP